MLNKIYFHKYIVFQITNTLKNKTQEVNYIDGKLG